MEQTIGKSALTSWMNDTKSIYDVVDQQSLPIEFESDTRNGQKSFFDILFR
jgi:hypothetical protein